MPPPPSRPPAPSETAPGGTLLGYKLALIPSQSYPMRDMRVLLKRLLRDLNMRCIDADIVAVHRIDVGCDCVVVENHDKAEIREHARRIIAIFAEHGEEHPTDYHLLSEAEAEHIASERQRWRRRPQKKGSGEPVSPSRKP